MSIALAGYGIEAVVVVGLAWIARNWVAKSRKDARDERCFRAVEEHAQRVAVNAAESSRRRS